MTPAPRAVAAVALGGAAGAVLRSLISDAAPDGTGFPTTILAVNVVGALLLALVPAVGAVRRSPTWTAALGPGLLGGFTTFSTFSEQTRALLDAGSTALAAAYVVATVAAGLVAVLLADRLSTAANRDDFAADEGDE